MKKLFLLLVVVAIAVGAFFVYRNRPQVQKFDRSTHSTIEKTQRTITNAVKEGTQKADELKTNVSPEVKAGLKQANKIATNVVAQVKELTTNVIRQVKQKIDNKNQ